MGEKGEQWYAQNVVYPFGYGLSYTTFEKEIANVAGDLSDPAGSVTVSVTVTNTGTRAGKETVQLYSTPPYTPGGIDKAAVNLVGFAKTKLLKPGQSQTVKVAFDVKDLASFDYNDANGNNNSGYELEKGKYVISLRENSHETLDVTELTAAETLLWDEDGDPATPNNIYSQDMDSELGLSNTLANTWTTSKTDHYLTRDKLLTEGQPSDLKKLAWLYDPEENQFVDEAFNVLNYYGEKGPATERDLDDPYTSEKETDHKNPWVIDSVPADWTQGTGRPGNDGLYETVLSDMIGIAYDDPKWDAFLNQLTWEEMVSLVNYGNFAVPGNAHIGKDPVSLTNKA